MSARARAIAQEVQDAARSEAAIERALAITEISQAVDLLGEIGANQLGHLSYRQALRFHKATEMLTDLVGELEGRS